MQGKLIRYYLPFRENEQMISSMEQAERILNSAIDYIKQGYKVVGITYSANFDQTRQIRRTYAESNWRTGISGANQAQVMSEMEDLLMTTYPQLQRKVQVLPITTMTYSSYGGKSHEEVVEDDLGAIERFVKNGGIVLGWTNQITHPEFAIGGGIARIPESLSKRIQSKLNELEIT